MMGYDGMDETAVPVIGPVSMARQYNDNDRRRYLLSARLQWTVLFSSEFFSLLAL